MAVSTTPARTAAKSAAVKAVPATVPAPRKAPRKTAAATPEPKKIEVNFDFERSTKGTHVFKEDADGRENEIIGKLYVRKTAIGDKAPAGITIEITVHA